jgi:hypothetical protein
VHCGVGKGESQVGQGQCLCLEISTLLCGVQVHDRGHEPWTVLGLLGCGQAELRWAPG